MKIIASSLEETRILGARIARKAQSGDVYALEGDLGTGKTEFTRGFIDELDESIIVRSPSFAIVNTYKMSAFSVYHFDFYRLTDSSELYEIGFDEYLSNEGVCIIEWATMFPEVLPDQTKFLRFTDKGNNERVIELSFQI